MKQFIGTVDKNKIDELMALSRQMCALMDLKSTLLDLAHGDSMIDQSPIKPEDVEKEIADLVDKKGKKLEEIRTQGGWSTEEMSRIQLMENAKVYMDKEL